MLKDITLGQYYPTESFVHSLDPRVKILLTFLFMIALFFVDKFYPYALVLLFFALVVKFSKIPVIYALKGIKPMWPLLLITFLVNAFLGKGEILASFWIINITREGVIQGLFMVIRLTMLIAGTSFLTLTTKPIELTDGIEKLLNPFKKIGLPAHEIAMMMSIALRFIPTLLEETDKIMKAQMARGADFESKKLIERAKSLIPLLVPLFISAFRRADELAMAMEARCYRGGEGRTRMNEILFDRYDYMVFVATTVFFVSICLTRYLPYGV
ncbi:energy-coupling factor transporter transmembrane component T family protein [Filifactor villosus]|uniref:Energy-coupling factor transporter transmembrane protein EcfT n=1 Tax=Filifactor villosus TaxID=29374 RepID=A0ABV9QLA3_9FIRM